MFLTTSLFFIGFYLLIKGSDILVSGATNIAKRLGISNIVIGLVIVGIGTSIPEFAVSVIANLSGQGDIGAGVIFGSNTFNILFILGLSSLLFPLQLKKSWVERDLLWNIAAVLIALFFGFSLFNSDVAEISKWEGVIMLALFMFWLYIVTKNTDPDESDDYDPPGILTAPIALVLIIGGLIGTIIGGKWIVDGAIMIASEFHVSESLIGLTAIGIGTSIPELAISLVATYRNQPGIAIGNIIGSNIFDFLLIFGIGSIIKPVVFPSYLLLDGAITLIAALLLFGSMYIKERYVLKRWQGFGFLLFYVFYFIYIIGRG
jgi:cation:H+ antiporter